MDSWSLPHTDLVRIFGDRTSECVLLQALYVILTGSQVLGMIALYHILNKSQHQPQEPDHIVHTGPRPCALTSI